MNIHLWRTFCVSRQRWAISGRSPAWTSRHRKRLTCQPWPSTDPSGRSQHGSNGRTESQNPAAPALFFLRDPLRSAARAQVCPAQRTTQRLLLQRWIWPEIQPELWDLSCTKCTLNKTETCWNSDFFFLQRIKKWFGNLQRLAYFLTLAQEANLLAELCQHYILYRADKSLVQF